MEHWIILSTPMYHFGMAILALLVLGILLLMWSSFNRRFDREHQIIVALCRLTARDIVQKPTDYDVLKFVKGNSNGKKVLDSRKPESDLNLSGYGLSVPRNS